MAHTEIIRTRPTLTRWQRLTHTLRSITLGPWNPKDRTIARHFGGGPVLSGVEVNERTATNYSAVWAAVNLISSDIGKVPLVLYKRSEDGRGKDRFSTHPLYRLMHDRPNPQMGSMVFRRTLQAHALIWGNGYAEIERDQAGRPVNLWPILPFTVEPKLEGGRLVYVVRTPGSPEVTLEAADVIHIRNQSDDGICGMSVIAKARESIGLGIAAEKFGASFFGNGATFGGVIGYPAGLNLSPEAKADNRKALENQHQGVERAHRLLALYEGAKYERLGIPPNDAQFLETREFQIEEVCRWFNLPPHKLKHLKRSTNNNIEHQGIEYVVDTLDPWWVIWEQELTGKLVPTLERTIQLIEHVREGLLRGDSGARGTFYSQRFNVASLTPNEIRAAENQNPVTGGDRAFIPLNMIPLDRYDEWLDAQIKAHEAPKPVPQPEPKAAEDDEEKKSLRQQVEDSRKNAQSWEDRHDKLQTELSAALSSLQAAMESHEATQGKAESLAARAHALDVELTQAKQRGDVLHADLTVTARELADTIAQRNALLDTQTAHEATIADLSTKALMLTNALDAVRSEQEAAKADIERLTGDLVEWQRNANEIEQEYIAKVAAVESERDEANGHAADASREVSSVTGERDAAIAESETLRADLARARADIAAELDKQKVQRGVLLTAMRSLFVDASDRLLQRESDRARKNQATPEKLRTWVENFYGAHAETCRAAFRPLVGPWTAITGGAPGLLLDRLVSEHVEASRTAMLHVVDVDDPDAMAAALERTLRRWETERAAGMADALVREGMAPNA